MNKDAVEKLCDKTSDELIKQATELVDQLGKSSYIDDVKTLMSFLTNKEALWADAPYDKLTISAIQEYLDDECIIIPANLIYPLLVLDHDPYNSSFKDDISAKHYIAASFSSFVFVFTSSILISFSSLLSSM